MVCGPARGADVLADAACLTMGPKGLHTFLSQRKKTPRSYKIRGQMRVVSAGGPRQQKPVEPKGPGPLLCHRFSHYSFHLPLGRAFVECFDLFPASWKSVF